MKKFFFCVFKENLKPMMLIWDQFTLISHHYTRITLKKNTAIKSRKDSIFCTPIRWD